MRRLSSTEIEARHAICGKCPHRKRHTVPVVHVDYFICSLCGCPILARVRIGCPDKPPKF